MRFMSFADCINLPKFIFNIPLNQLHVKNKDSIGHHHHLKNYLSGYAISATIRANIEISIL